MSTPGERGKETEKKVKTFLLGYSAKHAKFDFERLPDNRSSGGRVAAQVADFAWFAPGRHGVIEAKETEHESRLARPKITQLPMMRLRRLAGGTCTVIVYHSTLDKWRVPPFDFIADTEGPSWDLSPFPLFDTCADAMRFAGFA